MKLDKLAPYLLAAGTAVTGCAGKAESFYTINNYYGEDAATTDAQSESVVELDSGVPQVDAAIEAAVEAEADTDAMEEDRLTRAEIIKVLVFDVMEFPKGDCAEQKYPDVPVTDELCHALELYEARTGQGVSYPEGDFRPEDGLNHAEMWKITTAGLGFPAFISECAEGFTDVSSQDWYGSYAALCDKKIPLYGDDITDLSPGNFVLQTEWDHIQKHLKSYFEWEVTRIDAAEIMRIVVDEVSIPLDGACISKFDDIPHHTKDCFFANHALENDYMMPLVAEDEGTFFFPTLPLTYGEYAMYMTKPLGVTVSAPTGCSGVDPENFFAYDIDSLCEAGYADQKWGDNVSWHMPRLEAYKAAWKYSIEN